MKRLFFLFIPLLWFEMPLMGQYILIDAVPTGGYYWEDPVSGLSQRFLLGEVRTGTRANMGITVIEGFIQPLLPALIDSSEQVWPGDTDNSGIANMYDLLPIGIAYGSTGPGRPNASLNWVGQVANAWFPPLLANGTNYKHIDADGNGIINDDDTLGITLNYGLTHNKRDEIQDIGAPLSVQFLEDTLLAGDTAHVLIQLGEDTLLAQDVYGIVFSMRLDTSKVDHTSFRPDFGSSWLGTDNVDMLTLAHYHLGNESIDMGLVRTNQQNRNGYGPIASFSIIMIDDLAGKQPLSETLVIDVIQVRAISANENSILINAASAKDSLILENVNTSTDNEWSHQILVYPNPAPARFGVDLGALVGQRLKLYDIHGRLVHSLYTPFQTTQVVVEHLSSGTYILLIETDKGVFRRRIMLDSPSE
ncbi:MAG: T9SS type A sorting domain-containing protein [Bacteroidota bacterium]